MTYVAIKLECTCGSDDPFEHKGTCELWQSDAFRDGFFAWDVNAGELVDVDSLDDAALEALFDDAETVEVPPTTTVAKVLKCVCTPPRLYSCSACKVERKNPDLPWSEAKPMGIANTGGMGWNDDPWGWSKCRHYFQPITMPDGDTIYCSSDMSPGQRAEDEWPDFGIYFYSGWKAVTLAFQINWPDHGIPAIPMKDVLHAAQEGLRLAKSGSKVEIGCMGGHGRTGTFLAVMAMLQGVPGAEAEKWVHDNYCSFAVEGKQQEWYILAVDAHLRGVEAPPKPPEPVYTTSSNTWVSRSLKIDGVTHWWEKEWEEKTNYVTRDIVEHDGKIWVALSKPTRSKEGEPGKDNAWHEADEKVIAAVDKWKADQAKVDEERKAKEAKPPVEKKEKKKSKRHGLIWRGAWLKSETYRPGDLVSYLGEFYVCRMCIFKSISTPHAGTTFWKKAKKGVASQAIDPNHLFPSDDKTGLDNMDPEQYDRFVDKLKRRQRRDSKAKEVSK